MSRRHRVGKIMVEETVQRLKSGDLIVKIEAAKDVRKLVRKSSSSNSKSTVHSRFAIACVIEPLVSMLHSSLPLSSRSSTPLLEIRVKCCALVSVSARLILDQILEKNRDIICFEKLKHERL
ncbi:U-box domain-containing protein 4 [Salvia divinorum]|uniref:U-box domain-containing protein 4 n=1 Tax=Salvia divinorum TaxID=28513 RepID=A0ABD1FQQ0_SALDI